MGVQLFLKDKVWKAISKKLEKAAENTGNELEELTPQAVSSAVSGIPSTGEESYVSQSIPESADFSSSPLFFGAEEAGNVVATDFSPFQSLSHLDDMSLGSVFATPPQPAAVLPPTPDAQLAATYAEEPPQIDGWHFLGEGTFNRVYLSDEGKEVLKIQKTMNQADAPERSIRLWNAINPDRFPARLLDTAQGIGWVCPFIAGEQASDSDMVDALIDIYNKTGRIVADATAPTNFIKTPDGQVVCIDVGMAIQLERREEKQFSQRVRRHSVTSLDSWSSLKSDYEPFFKMRSEIYPETVKMVKALVLIKDNRPDMVDVDFLKTTPELVGKLAKAYDRQNSLDDALGHLDDVFGCDVFMELPPPTAAPSSLDIPSPEQDTSQACRQFKNRFISATEHDSMPASTDEMDISSTVRP
ncbi:MAG: hypothetical protein P4L79_08035 [Legionella sp.]|uniref:hypothetical protein n=1 Tax=Legionella sp. TaxID=459 RepID=UPI00284BBA63|nr:hypothetical protein [Legionella sp.]